MPPKEKWDLLHRLLVSVKPCSEPGADAAWEAEIARRIARFDRGESVTVSAAEVLSGLREIAPER